MRKSLLLSCLALNIGFFTECASAQQYATILFDNTGSMQQTRTDGKTRCQYGKDLFLTSVGLAFGKADYLNVKTFGAPGQLFSLSSGFYNIAGLTPLFGPGKVFYDNIQRQVNALSCDAYSTALGDAVCDSIDELRSSVLSTTTQLPRIALVTDAGENSSQRCGGTNYANTHILPRTLNPAPKVRLDITILVPGGNVTARMQNSLRYVPSYEIYDTNSTLSAVATSGTSAKLAATAPVYSSEVQSLINAAQASGGGAIVIQDNKTCTSKCDPLSQGPSDDDWGGAW